MSNSQSPFGLKPAGKVKNTALYYIPNSLAKIAIGTPVKLSGTANTTSLIKGQNHAIGSLPAIAVAGNNEAFIGAIIGFVTDRSDINGQSGVNPASTEGIAIVSDDPEQLYDIVDDGTAIPATSIGLNANIVPGAVNAIGLDGTALKTSEIASTAGHQLKIIAVKNKVGNEGAVANAIIQVAINKHQRKDFDIAGI